MGSYSAWGNEVESGMSGSWIFDIANITCYFERSGEDKWLDQITKMVDVLESL